MIWILPLLLFCTGCTCFPFDSHGFTRANNEDKYQTYTQKIDPLPFSEVIIPYAVELRYTKRLRFEDSKVYYDDFVERIRVIFSSQEVLELCETRDLMVTVVEGLLERLNGSPAVAEAFDHFPITSDDLELYFSFESFNMEYNDPTYIAWMSLHDGLVRYFNGLLKDPHKDYWDARIEPYYKSFEFVQITRAAEAEMTKQLHLEKHQLDSHTLDL